MLKRLLLALVFISAPILAHAQCTGWPVTCTGIHPGGGVGGADVAAAIAGWAIGQALSAAAQPQGGGTVTPQNALNIEGNKFANAGNELWQKNDCAHAVPLLRKSIPYYQQALALGSNDTITGNLQSVKRELGWCSALPTNTKGQNFIKAGDAYVEKGRCRDAATTWMNAKTSFEHAKAIYDVPIFSENIKATEARIQKMTSGGYDDKCQDRVAVLRPAPDQSCPGQAGVKTELAQCKTDYTNCLAMAKTATLEYRDFCHTVWDKDDPAAQSAVKAGCGLTAAAYHIRHDKECTVTLVSCNNKVATAAREEKANPNACR